jgi:PhzF family phenazine biosynthesis protein
MKRLRFKKIDAFTDGKSSGNPAAALYPESTEDVPEAEMQRIALELKGFVSEAAFVFPEPENCESEFRLRYFSCEREVEFCGHATIAVMYDLVKNNQKLISKNLLKIRTNRGLLTVMNKIREEDAVFMSAPAPEYIRGAIHTGELACALNIDESRIDTSMPVSIVNGGLITLLVPLRSLDDCIMARPDYEVLRNFCLRGNIEIVNIFTGDTRHRRNRYRTRVFAPAFGYLEDPATGSGNASLAYYLRSAGAWSGDDFSIEQGPDRECPNIIRVSLDNNDCGERVAIGGRAVVKIDGWYSVN